MPIKLDMAKLEGELPALAQAVVVVGELSTAGGGYALDVQEVRSGDKVLLSKKAAATDASDGAASV